MIELSQFYMGRDKTHAHILGSDLRANASRTVEAANKLLTLAKGAGVRVFLAVKVDCPEPPHVAHVLR